jgi:hypothetical protein
METLPSSQTGVMEQKLIVVVAVTISIGMFGLQACGVPTPDGKVPSNSSGCATPPLGNYRAEGSVLCRSGAIMKTTASMGFSTSPDGGTLLTYNEEVPVQRTDCRVLASIRVDRSSEGTVRADSLDLVFQPDLAKFSGTETLNLRDFYCDRLPDGGQDYSTDDAVISWEGVKL